MSLEVQCEQCGKAYRVGDEHAGKRVRCKACQAVINIPTPAAVIAPPPLPRMASNPSYPASAATWPPPPMATIVPPTNQSHRKLIITLVCCFGALLVLGGIILAISAIFRGMRSSGILLTDSEIREKLVGDWAGTPRTPEGLPVTANLTFNADGTFHFNLRITDKLADYSGTWTVQNRRLQHTITAVHFGKQSIVGPSQPLGRVNQISDTQLTLGTDNGVEIYHRVTKPALSASIPRAPALPSPTAPMHANTTPMTGPPAVLSNPGLWSDLLPAIDVPANAQAGNWTLESGALTGSNPNQRIPARLVLGPAPQGNYEVEITFNRQSGSKEFGVIFPVGHRPAQLQIGGMSGQFSSIGNVATIQSINAIVNNTDQTLHLIVTGDDSQAAIAVTLDGKPYLSWHGPTRRLHVTPNSALPDPRDLGLFVHNLSTVQFKSIRVRSEQ